MFDLVAYFGCDDITNDVIIESSEFFENFHKCITGGGAPLVFGFAVLVAFYEGFSVFAQFFTVFRF